MRYLDRIIHVSKNQKYVVGTPPQFTGPGPSNHIWFYVPDHSIYLGSGKWWPLQTVAGRAHIRASKARHLHK